MVEPSAMLKARSLERYLRGCTKREAYVCVTDREAWELLEWCADDQGYATSAAFVEEMTRAKATNDPWPVLTGFQLRGFQLSRLTEEIH